MNAIEIDFLPVGSETKCGDAICIRYGTPDAWRVMVVDGGDLEAGKALVSHITSLYGANTRLEHVVCTHSDQDHVSGLRPLLEAFEVETLWVHQPWRYAAILNPYFKGNWADQNLADHLRDDCFPIVAELADAAEALGIHLAEPFAGQVIGPFTVLAPSADRLLELYPQMDQTPAQKTEATFQRLFRRAKAAVYSVFETWDIETLGDPGPNGTSVPNETSVVLYSPIGGGALLTGDAGVGALIDAAWPANRMGIDVSRPAFIQVPHHGSRHNVSPEVLNHFLGPKLPADNPTAAAHVSSAAKSEMPRRQVENAFRRRGYNVQSTKGRPLTWRHGFPPRPGWNYGLQPGPFHAFVEE